MQDRCKVLELFETQKDYMGKKVADGIEKYRKGNAKITLIDKNGGVIENAVIKVNQKSHEFRFGANLFMLDELETPEKNEKYKRFFSDLFNMATLPFYWDATEPEKGKTRYEKDSPKIYRRPSIDLCLEFCEKHNIEPREHGLAYEGFFPNWLCDASIDEIKSELERRYQEISKRYANKIKTIEVTNEMDGVKGKTKFYDAPEYVQWCFDLAKKYFPKNELVINEYTPLCWGDKVRATDKYYSYIEANLLKGARIDAIGMQYHVFETRKNEYEKTRRLYSPQNLYKHMDMYALLKRPLQVTEVTVPAYSWEEEDERIQAEIIGNLYSIWFSHPNMEQIIYWNLIDGYAFVPDATDEKIKASQGDMTLGENYYYGGLLRFDMTPKPSYYKLKELIQKVWHTQDTLYTNENGEATFKGFYGDYDVEIVINGKCFSKEVSLSKNHDNTFVIEI